MTDKLSLALMVGENVTLNVISVFLLVAIGFVLAKKKMLTPDGVKQITELVLCVVVPVVFINAYQRDFDIELLKNLGLVLLFAVIVHVISIVFAPFFFKDRGDKTDRIGIYSTVYSNCGFIALPLVNSLYGSEGVFYAVAYITVFAVLYWTHGIYIYTKDVKQLSLKNAFLSPGPIGAIIGIALFLLRIRLPEPILKTTEFISSLNTPLPMMIIGTYLVGFDIKAALKDGRTWMVNVLRLVVAPIVGIVVAKLLNLSEVPAMTMVLSCACPVAAIAALFAARYSLDSKYASQMVSISTILSIVTIPLIMVLATLIL